VHYEGVENFTDSDYSGEKKKKKKTKKEIKKKTKKKDVPNGKK
jgi:hypothetical protein